jgi:pyruvate/2-oxoglutarate dehydrogenase complex dihydrolipoamide acyltransferase (E2) component
MDRYRLQAAHPFHDVTRLLIGREVRMADTVSFLGEVDLSEVESIRRRSTPKERPSYTAFVVKALAQTLEEFPCANRRLARRWLPFLRWRMQEFTTCDVGVAVERDVADTSVATFISVIRDADRSSLTQLTETLRAAASADETTDHQWRDYHAVVKSLPPWLSSRIIGLPNLFPSLWSRWRGGAALVSSPSKYGVDTVIGAWPSPLGVSFGLVKERAVVRAGQISARPTFTLTMNFDRRIMAGASAARMFKRLIERLENAQRELVTQASMPSPGDPSVELMDVELNCEKLNAIPT